MCIHMYCMYVCVSCYKCIFVFHFCFCFASCFLFGAVLLTWLKLEHNNNTSHYIEILPHTPTQFTHRHTRHTHVFVYAWSLTVSWKPYSAQLILLCCCCCFFFFVVVVRFVRWRKSINFCLHFSLQFCTLFMPFSIFISFSMHSLTFIAYFAIIYN